MKIFHKKFLDQPVFREEDKPAAKGKVNYLLHQLLIWGGIFFIIYFIVKFYTLDV